MMLNRLKPQAEKIIAEEQAGFRAGRSTTEQIFNLRILCERRDCETSLLWNQQLKISEMSSIDYSHTPLFEQDKEPMIDEGVFNVLNIVIYVVALGIICLFGIIFNAINIYVFFKQGFKDTVNITPFSLAVSDMGNVVTLLWMSVCFNPLFAQSILPVVYHDLAYITSGWPHTIFARISSLITAFVTFERCLCIALPLKVKTIITPRRTIYVIVSIYIGLAVCAAPAFYSVSLGPKHDSEVNMTMLGVVYIPNGVFIEGISLYISAFSQVVSFFSVIVCTVILVQNLLIKSRWRKSSSSTAKQESVSNRDMKVVKMVVSIAGIFIVGFSPSVANIFTMLAIPDFNYYGEYHHIYVIVWGISFLLVTTNSAVNIFVYYYMSSKFKEILDDTLKKVRGKCCV
ncbi:neurotensin receptor type 2-like [Aplysia californica]|uniref:Neurotensin receptor type 2-like n=1 Tax=Aplysia californica TaxID=6500 RepID=A0ABM1A956_APLCA|nr:neurotensin receptor type 2-like [Aplysia californica]